MPASRKPIVKSIEGLIYLCLLYGVVAVPLFLLDLPLLYFAAAGLILLAVVSVMQVFKRKVYVEPALIYFCGAIFGALGFWAAVRELWALVVLHSVLLLISAIACIAFMHMAHMDISLEAVRLSSAQPIKRIINFNYKLVAAFSLVLFLLTLAVFFAATRPIGNFIGGLGGGRTEARYTPSGEYTFRDSFGETLALLMRQRGTTLYMDGSSGNELSPFWRIFFTVTAFTAGIAGSLFFAFLIFRGIFRWLTNRDKIYHYDMGDRDSADESEFILPSKKAKPRRAPKGEHPLRRLFRETIVRHMRQGVAIRDCDTPTDMARRIHGEDIGGLVEEYKKVRYDL